MKPVADGKMFTFRLSSYQFLQHLLIFFSVSSELINGETLKKCAAFNEYCLNHWDCCSNSCMSYLYRCTRGYGIYPYPFLGVTYKPTVTLDQILEQNFGSSDTVPAYQPKPYFASRVGSIDEAATNEIKIVLQNSEETISEATTLKNPLILEETSLVYERHVDATTIKNPVDLEEISAELNNDGLGEEITTSCRNNTVETTQATAKKSKEKPSCAEIGEKCFNREECCSKLCHGYLHQCVT